MSIYGGFLQWHKREPRSRQILHRSAKEEVVEARVQLLHGEPRRGESRQQEQSHGRPSNQE